MIVARSPLLEYTVIFFKGSNWIQMRVEKALTPLCNAWPQGTWELLLHTMYYEELTLTLKGSYRHAVQQTHS